MRRGALELLKGEDEALSPKAGDVVKALYANTERRVEAVSSANIVYLTPAANGGWWKRNCLPVTWERWCRRKRAFVERNDSI